MSEVPLFTHISSADQGEKPEYFQGTRTRGEALNATAGVIDDLGRVAFRYLSVLSEKDLNKTRQLTVLIEQRGQGYKGLDEDEE